jgi:endoglucanase
VTQARRYAIVPSAHRGREVRGRGSKRIEILSFIARQLSFLARGLFLGLALNGAFEETSAASARDPSNAPAFAALDRMRRGVNILGYDGLWKGETDAPFRMSDFKRIREAGFDHVRINFFGFPFMDARDRLDERVLVRLDRVLDEAEANDLTPVLDQHDNELCQSAPDKCQAKLVSFWRQMAARYARKRSRLVFEILNEPGGDMSVAQWNEALAAALKEIRAKDLRRLVIVAALNVSGPRVIERLDLPVDDNNLIVTVHYYAPHDFTFQGAPWSKEFADRHDVAWGADASRAQVVTDLAIVANWAKDHGRPVYLGEFGVYDRAPPKSRAAWIRHVAKTAERFGWGWAYWQFDHDFSLTDPTTREWNGPLLDALMK